MFFHGCKDPIPTSLKFNIMDEFWRSRENLIAMACKIRENSLSQRPAKNRPYVTKRIIDEEKTMNLNHEIWKLKLIIAFLIKRILF